MIKPLSLASLHIPLPNSGDDTSQSLPKLAILSRANPRVSLSLLNKLMDNFF